MTSPRRLGHTWTGEIPVGLGAAYGGEIRFDGFGEIGHDYLMIRSNLGALSVGFMGSLKLQCLCRSWLFPEVKFV